MIIVHSFSEIHVEVYCLGFCSNRVYFHFCRGMIWLNTLGSNCLVLPLP